MNRILLSLIVIGAVAAAGAGLTTAFFSDTETSTGNTISAGSIDLKIDNTSYLNNLPNVDTSWTLADLTNQLFFNFSDIQPATFGEDTISLHSTDPAYACMRITKTLDDDVTCSDPEQEAEAGACVEDAIDDTTTGELGQQLNFYFWGDDGDNVYETDEVLLTSLSGPAATIFDGTWKALIDSDESHLFGSPTALPANGTAYLAKYWCYGTAAETPVGQDGFTAPGNRPDSEVSPGVIRGSGFSCDGISATNHSQTDKLMADVSFYGVQSANNGSFQCQNLTL